MKKRLPLSLAGYPNKCRALTLVEVLISVMIIGVLAALLWGAMSRADGATRQAACLSNLKALHNTLNFYANDHQDCYPPSYYEKRTWTWQLQSYLNGYGSDLKGIFYCPTTRLGGKGIYLRNASSWFIDYDINGNIATTTELKNKRTRFAGNLILLYDGPGGAPNGVISPSRIRARHGNGFNVITVNGSASRMMSTEFTADRIR